MPRAKHRPELKMLICLLLLLGVAFLWGCAGSPLPSGQKEQPQAELKWISGEVLSCSSQSFLLLDEQQQARLFPRPQEQAAEMQPGCQVKLSYKLVNGNIRIQQFILTPLSREEELQRLLSGLTVEEKVGQLFLARCPQEKAPEWVASLHLGGYILFDRDLRDRSPEQVRANIASYQAMNEIPLFIAVDEEGGQVVRASSQPALRSQAFPSVQSLFAQGGWEAIQADTREKCSFLQDLGFNLNMAPVADVSTSSQDYIYSRSFGQGGEETAQYVRTVVEIMEEQQMGSVLKHFPGYGGNGDTHTGSSHDQRSYESLQQRDFLPFQAGIEAGASMVLVSHNTVDCLDASQPASLSPAVIAVLRQELSFQGVVITDDLSMAAAKESSGENPPAVRAILAGCDLICSSDFPNEYHQILDAVEDGRISGERLDASVLRILQLKQDLDLL